MKLFDKFNRLIGFTPSESKVVLFLVLAFLSGWGIKLYKNSVSRQKQFDYSAADSAFSAGSRVMQSGIPEHVSDESSSSAARFATSTLKKKAIGKKININTATKDELVSLPGIGKAMAERIALYRNEHGPFATVGELERVKGIGRKKLERLAPYCTTEK